MSKCTYMQLQGICTVVHCLHSVVLCMMDLKIMPKDWSVLLPTP